ncbi:hypothetical protein AOC36_10510 [Erysipelothrix larvae]|uniref:3-oxoacyl-[acyl-carrier-protein] reductase n=1 Tax=Erysipelothrix larvae TaxID=1514105 RepID=A0A0X8H1K4_9FIRM|nr:3-oxoacyl-[acyl-carrier-protein] reductase [Erysipelothrix larvae]AMC94388.1 hypothetical protein AOC36_10510 [Erysipelothrix larvae]
MNRKIAVVTGATKGIGYHIAQQLVADGYYVIGTYVSNYDQHTLESLETETFELRHVDATDYDQCNQLCTEIQREFTTISVLVNNAGIVRDGIVLTMTQDDFNQVVDTNLGGSFNMVKAFSKSMLRQKAGCIVNITSVIGVIGNAGQSNYAASKAGLIGFSKSIAKEFAGRNIRVNCVAPGFIETEMTDSLTHDIKTEILRNIALKRFGTPQDVADAVSFLVSEKAQYITGQVINVCGGMVM